MLALIGRAVALGIVPLLDPSEGRYAVIAQEMVRTGDWITPVTYLDGVRTPFLGKPPLFFWLSAVSIKLFGENEFGVRFGGFLASILLLVGSTLYAWRVLGEKVALVGALIFASSGLFFIFSGVCLTDTLLALLVGGVVLSFGAFTEEIRIDSGLSRRWGLLVFFFSALGFLTKGPIALVIPGIAIFLWLIIENELSILLRLPWIGGISLFLLVATPWFLFAEHATPGFIEYFFVNENFKRFLVKDYGDLYGSAHTVPFGTVWLFALAGFMPWSVFLPFFVKVLRDRALPPMERKWFRLFLLWGLSPLIFFSIGKQVSISYVLPGMAGLSYALAYTLVKRGGRAFDYVPYFAGGAVVIMLATMCALGSYAARNFSTKEIAIKLLTMRSQLGDKVEILGKVPNSFQFYLSRSEGSKLSLVRSEDIKGKSLPPYLVGRERDLMKLSNSERLSLSEVERVGSWSLLARHLTH